MEVRQRDIESIEPYGRNPRINEQAIEAVAASIAKFGFRQPIVVDEAGVIIVGHVRWMAAKKLGLAQVPVHVAKGLTSEQAKAYRIADNQTAALAEWDYELLAAELRGLEDDEFDLAVLGFGAEQLATLLHGGLADGLTDPDAVPAPPDEAVTQRGDLWLLGGHRLLCGDSGRGEDVDHLLDGALVHLVNTDPPYNVKNAPRSAAAIEVAQAAGKLTGQQGMDAAIRHSFTHSIGGFDHTGFTERKRRKRSAASKLRPRDRAITGDFLSDEKFACLLRAWFGNITRVLEPGRAFYIWGGYSNIWNYPNALRESELYFSQMIIWVKEHPVLTRKDFMGNHEWCFYGWKEGAAHKFYGPPNVTDVWSVKKVNPQSMVHLTEKPVELAVRAMQYSSLAGENVLDLFGGSGSTLIAAEQTARRAYLMEIDPLYCDVIVQRWEEFTGRKAERIAANAKVKTASKPKTKTSAASGAARPKRTAQASRPGRKM